jgi:ABC-type polysaccharide/polyol phosphate export permease
MPPLPPSVIYDSAQRRSAALEELKELRRYHYLVFQMVRRDVLARYKRSVLGVMWTMLNPLGTTIVLAIVFSQIFSSTESYPAYVLSGLLPWTFFAQTTNACMAGLIWGNSLIKRIYLPRTIFSVSAIGVGLVNLVISLVPLLLVMLATGVKLQWSALLLPIPIIFLALFALGIGLMLSTLAIQFADVAEMYQIILTAWMYLSPVIYHESILPAEYIWFVRLNPMYYLIDFFRAFIYEGRIPGASEFLVSATISGLTLLVGWWFFCRKADEFAHRV